MSGEHPASGLLVPDGPLAVRWGAVELAHALGQAHAPTPEQVAVIEAPLRPLLVVAGAGSGKTETMAARVVWLVANGLVRPRRGARADLHPQGRGRARPSGVGARLRTLREARPVEPRASDGPAPRCSTTCPPSRPTTRTPAGIVREHALRLGLEPESRLLSEAAAWQVAPRGGRVAGTARWTTSRRPSRP